MSVVIKGNVSVKIHGILKHKQLPGHFGVLFDGGGRDNKLPRLELYEEATARSPVHTVQLEHLKFADKSYRHQDTYLLLSIKKEKHQFHFDQVEDKEDWVQSFCHISSDLWKQRASTLESSELEEADSQEDMSENVLYDSFDNVQQFKVSVNQTKASEANDLKGHFLLNPTKESLRLLDSVSFKSIHEWPYRQIRKYGRTRNIFRMEVGRRCTTGEGEFEFFTPEGPTLTDLITVYTRQAREEDKKRSEEDLLPPRLKVEMPPPPAAEYVNAATPSPEQIPPPLIPRRVSENYREGRDEDGSQQRQARSSTFSLGSKKEPPKPAPRSAVPASPVQENGSTKPHGRSHPPDRKIYETSTGLTAPLHTPLKQELHDKLQVQLSDPDSLSEGGSSMDYVQEADSYPGPEGADGGADKRHSSQGAKEKKKSDKERKKQEREEAKRKKQQEKEEKARKEREAKEQKEREKEQKKGGKGLNKLSWKKSDSKAAAASHDPNHIYDEPGDLASAAKNLPSPPESHYEEPDIQSRPPAASSKAMPGNQVSDIYSTPQKPKKGSWKNHALPENEDIHQENYDSIKLAALSQPESQPPPIPPQSHFSHPLPSAEDVDETYNRLGDFSRQTVSQPAPENIYGMASAVSTVGSRRPQPVGCGNEYEETDTLNSLQGSHQQAASNEYEDTAVQPQKRNLVCIPDFGDYADIK